MTLASARLQQDGWRDWLLWTQAVAEHTGGWAGPQHHRQAVIGLLTADGGEFLTFAMMTARKNKRVAPRTGQTRFVLPPLSLTDGASATPRSSLGKTRRPSG